MEKWDLVLFLKAKYLSTPNLLFVLSCDPIDLAILTCVLNNTLNDCTKLGSLAIEAPNKEANLYCNVIVKNGGN